MKKLFLLLLFAFPVLLHAQGFYEEFAQKDTNLTQRFAAICADSAGFIDAGGYMYDSAGFQRAVFVRFNANGAPVLSQRLFAPSTSASVVCLAADTSGFWAICNVGPYTTALLRMDENFTILWGRRIFETGHNVIAISCRPDHHGGCYVSGCYYQPSVYNMPNLGFIMRYDASGNVQWSNLYTLNDHGFLPLSMDAQTVNNGFVSTLFINHLDSTTGHTYYSAGLMKVYSGGNLAWIKTFADSTYHYPLCMTMLADSSFVIGGISDLYNNTGNYEVFLTRIDKNGEHRWTRRVVQSPSFELNYGLTETDQHTILFAFQNPGDSSVARLEVDTAGNYVSARQSGVISVVRAQRLVRLPGQGIYLAGESIGLNGSHALLMGFDPSGAASCEDAPQALALAPESFRTDHPAPAVTAGPQSMTYTATTVPFFINKGNCPPAGVEEQQAEEATLFPNPATEEVTVQFSQWQEGQYTLFDVQGREVGNENFSGASFVLNRDGLSDGIYFLRISTKDGRSFSRKIVFSS